MRNRCEEQFSIGHRLIIDTPINLKHKDKFEDLLAALKVVYSIHEYNQMTFGILEHILMEGKKKTGRKGMDLWSIFVLSQVRLCLGVNYEWLYNLANNHLAIRWLMGVETEVGFDRIEFSYQSIYENVTLINDDKVKEINSAILKMDQKVFKQKRNGSLALKG